jgi:hypothetical protein
MKTTTALALTALFVSPWAHAQWAQFPDRAIPRLPSGGADLTAPAPRDDDGNPDLSGVWLPDTDPLPEGVTLIEAGQDLPRHMINIAADLSPEEVELRPWAAALLEQRLANRGVDSPMAHCKPTGVPLLNAVVLPYKIVQTRDLVVVLYEENSDFRQIFLDGREPVDEPLPRWMGYSSGRWEDDELVVETVGLTEESWLDGMGHPHSGSLRVIERFRRPDAGHLAIETTIDDPEAYARPITYTVTATALPDDDLLEYFCTENEKSSAHYQ